MYFTAYIPQTFYAMLFSALSCYSTHQAQRGSFSLLGLNGPFFLWCSEHHLHKYGNPLQCSCLENPRDGGAWWAPVYGVAQSRTRLKRRSSSSSSSSRVCSERRRKWQPTPVLLPGKSHGRSAGVQPRWIQGIRRVDGVGVERLVYLLI